MTAALLGAALGIIGAGPAAAQSPICADLQQQYLASLSARGGNSQGQRMVDMDRLSRDLANAEMAARQGNCNRFLFFGPRPSPQCPAIQSAIAQLRQQLAQARRGGNLLQASPQQDRQRLRDWLMQNGCNIPESGSTRTVCVRTCDGYFFPISFSASRQQYARDAEVCQSMYAESGQAELFTYNTGRDFSDAVSTTGRRYGDQPYAFLYRQGFFRTCEVQLKEGIAALGARYFQARSERVKTKPERTVQVAFAYPLPRMRPTDRQEDPETVANRAGGLAVAPYVPEAERATTFIAAADMRLVGAAYYAELFDPNKPAVEQTTHRPPLGFDLIASAKAAIAKRAKADLETTGTWELR